MGKFGHQINGINPGDMDHAIMNGILSLEIISLKLSLGAELSINPMYVTGGARILEVYLEHS